ncbi:MAG: hypothetical protein IPN90_02940 [Elusimicrobia bacterium]|nr:hypothetical protein [Elusimicrobiota bacterium]
MTFVGHPLWIFFPGRVKFPKRWNPRWVCFPGSRPGEVARLPVFLRTAELLPRSTRFVLFAAPTFSNVFYDGFFESRPHRPTMLEVVRDENYQWRRGVDMALACSGTATLENALLGFPRWWPIKPVGPPTSWPGLWFGLNTSPCPTFWRENF